MLTCFALHYTWHFKGVVKVTLTRLSKQHRAGKVCGSLENTFGTLVVMIRLMFQQSEHFVALCKEAAYEFQRQKQQP